MNLHQLEVFKQVARCKSFSQAARLMHLTQPAISTQIRNIESFYGITLFNRSGKGVELTPAGETMYRYARQIMSIHSNMEKELDILAGNNSHELLIGATAAIGNYGLPCSLWAFKEKYPGIQLHLEIGRSNEIAEKVEAGEIQIGILGQKVQTSSFICKNFMVDELIVIAPPKPEWLNKNNITLAELVKHPLVLREKGAYTRQMLENTCQDKDISLEALNIVAEITSLDAIKSTVASGGGLAVLQQMAVRREEIHNQLAVLELTEPSLTVDYYLIHREIDSLSPSARRFLNFISTPADTFC